MAKTRAPLYRRIANDLRDQILSGTLEAGAQLPRVREMMTHYQASRVTVDDALKVLKQEGLVTSLPRQRVTVRDLSHRATSLEDRAAARRATGRALARNETSRILFTGLTSCPADVAQRLGITEGADVLCRARVTYRDGAPVATSRSYYLAELAELAPELTRPESIPSGSRELAAERMGASPRSKGEKIEEATSRLATAEEAELLHLSASPPAVVTQVTRTVLLPDGRVVEVATKVNEGSRPVVFRSPATF